MHRVAWLIALALLVVACGEGDEPVSGSGSDPDRPVQAPAEPPAAGTPVPVPATPERCKQVSRRVVGRSMSDAQALVGEARCSFRVVVDNGRSLPVTEDFNPSRINVRIQDGEVAEVMGLF